MVGVLCLYDQGCCKTKKRGERLRAASVKVIRSQTRLCVVLRIHVATVL